MSAWTDYGIALGVLLGLGCAGWLYSLWRRNVNIVDSLWPLFLLAAAAVYAALTPAHGPRTVLVLLLTAIWALRLSLYLAWRNHGKPEDRRYRAIRRNNEPGFALKSLYIVFGLQAVLASLVSLPLLAAVDGGPPLGAWDALGVLLWLIGMVFQVGGDAQLAAFKADPANRDRVLERGFWRYTRHPNYFGEFCIWWGLFLIAVGAGGAWSIVSPLLMTVLLLKVSGVALLERDIGARRPAYAEYVRTTNAFFPGPRKPARPRHAASAESYR